MNSSSRYGKVTGGFAEWMQAEQRAGSKAIEFGEWWRLGVTRWRVRWLETTTELYAVEVGKSDRFILLTCLSKKEMNDLRKTWMDGDSLSGLLQRVARAA
jgi:hypothetical protein